MKMPIRWLFVPLAASALWQPVRSWSCGGGDEYVPPLLSSYKGRLPGRSLGRILKETGSLRKPSDQGHSGPTISQILSGISDVPAKELVTKVDEALIDARENRDSKSYFAVLHDLRDLFAADAVPAEAMGEYARERWQMTTEPPSFKSGDAGYYSKRPVPAAEEQMLTEAIAECEAGKRPRGLLPHYLYWLGAVHFHAAKDVESEKWFLRVVKEFPDHPRAETALFMAGRSAFSQTRGEYGSHDGNDDKTQKALQIFADYRKRYPNGRFLGDVLGWEGGLYYDSGKALEALRCYAAQLQYPGHPELQKSAIPMCERCMRKLCYNKPAADMMAVVIQDRALTQALVYHMLWTEAPYDVDGQQLVDAKTWRQAMLHIIAEALPVAEKQFTGPVWQPRFLAILAHALSGDGRQTEALAILDRNAKEGAVVEEWCFARAVVLERLEKSDQALTAYDSFIASFPASTWLPDAQRRRAGVLKDMGKADEAILALRAEKEAAVPETGMIYPESDEGLNMVDSALAPSLSLCDEYNRDITLEALFYGAPVEQLARLALRNGMDAANQAAMKAHLARRLIAQGRYEEAVPYLPPEMVAAMGIRKMPAPSDGAGWLRMGKIWSAARTRWLAVGRPADDHEGERKPLPFFPILPSLYSSRDDLRDALETLQFSEAADSRRYDELTHALEFCRRAIAAARDKDSKIAGEAMQMALDAMPVLARSNHAMLALARQEDWSGESRRWWQRLESMPDRRNGAGAMYWSFGVPAAPQSHVSRDSDEYEYQVRLWANDEWTHDPDFIFGTLGTMAGTAQEEWNRDQGRLGLERGRGRNVLDDLVGLRGVATSRGVDALHTDCVQILKEVMKSQPATADAFVVNALNDLVLASAVAQVPPEALNAYVDFRLDCLSNASWGWHDLSAHGLTVQTDSELLVRLELSRKQPSLAALADFWDALEISLMANYGSTRNWAAVYKLCQTFLTVHPHSVKREAVFVHLARAAYRSRRPAKDQVLERWRELGLDARNRASNDASLPWDAKPALEVIAAYRAEFPQGALHREIEHVEAYTAWRNGDYGKAITLACALLGDPEAYAKHTTAAALLVNIFAELEEPRHRGPLLQALRESEPARGYLAQYLKAAEEQSGKVPLSFMGDFLREQLIKDGDR